MKKSPLNTLVSIFTNSYLSEERVKEAKKKLCPVCRGVNPVNDKTCFYCKGTGKI